ncbi:hypothetical protein [uncultured Jatrophihabitans sp.]|uniref:hypothetical protein n=1 Tax=uncultured Jatrophihabitans sp. TaxID=1610747 RepID=UPI0035CB4BDD
MGTDNGGGNYASIDPGALKAASSALHKSVDGVNNQIVPLLSDFEENGVPTTAIDTLKRIAAKIAPVIPELNRRVSMAQQLVAENPGGGKVAYFQGDLLGSFKTVAAAKARAHIDAGKVDDARKHGHSVPQDVYDDLTKYGDDPDYATAFVKDLGPTNTAFILFQVEHYTGDRKPHVSELSALGETFSTASYHTNFDAHYMAQLSDGAGNLGAGIDPLDIFTPMMKYGTWSKTSLEDIADNALQGPSFGDGPGRMDSQSMDNIFLALANNPVAAADYYHKNQQGLYDLGNSKLPTQPTLHFINFLHSATIDARSTYAQMALNDPRVKNLAEMNANFLVNKVGQDGDQSHGLLEKTYADIGVEYFDDYQAQLQSPIDLSTFHNVNWLPVNASEDSWKKFFGAGVTNDQGLLELAAKFKSSLTGQEGALNADMQKAFDTGKNPAQAQKYATSWQRYAHDEMQKNFTDIMKTLKQNDAKSFDDRKNAVKGLVSQGLDWLEDPSSIPGDIAAKGAGAVNDWLSDFITDKTVGEPPKRPSVPITRTSLDQGSNYATSAVQQWNQGQSDVANGKTKHPFGFYNDGDVDWNGKPNFYDPHHLFTNSDGTIKTDSNGEPDWDAITKSPQSLHDFQQWLLDPAVQAHVSADPSGPNN